MKKRNDQAKQKKIAEERIEILFQKAEQAFPNTKRANRYIDIARHIAMKLNIHMSKKQKRSFCKHCYTYLVSGVNAQTRIRNGNIIIYCKECKKYTRIPIK
ncbi:MAG: ribonuclease P protein subunit RPR2 [archaeon GW2011_AR17]|nr:MAG: ribonuclease P protein subunit RPR2 [archaeon GW2011_AR17]MBS3153859.1 ribonuclease P [Candidatus Woesearchaeota archaeon]HIH15460.1 ribonuclease P [Nanoarchaeota archaeon]HIH59263.1 ribonuclease P [Nanoarchaeota archaeon]HII13942.1 ribonuclease P [Nanoarchaeota archaeon]